MMAYEEVITYFAIYIIVSFLAYYFLISRIGYLKRINECYVKETIKHINNSDMLDEYILRDFDMVKTKNKKKK